VSDIDTAEVDSLKALDPEWPIREADIDRAEILQCSGSRPPLRNQHEDPPNQRSNAEII